MISSTSRSTARGWGLLTCLVAAVTFPLAAQAESATRSPKPDPLDPKAAVPALTYASSLKLDQRVASVGPTSWREANDTVTRIGGWRVYAREASQPATESKPTPFPAAPQPLAPTAPAVLPAPAVTPHAHGGHPKP